MLWSPGLGSAGARIEVSQHQTNWAARTAKKCRGGFLPRILGWEHSIPYASPIPGPPRGRETEGGITLCSYIILKIPPLCLLAPLLNLSAAGFYVFFSVQIWPSGSVSWSLPWTFTLTSLLISAFSPIPPLAVTLRPLPFLSSVCGGVYVWVSEGSTGSSSCGLACGQALIHWFEKCNDIILWFVLQIVEWQ